MRKPAEQTKRGNYILRSVHRDSLLRVLELADDGKIVVNGHGIPIILNAYKSWAANCEWEVTELVKRGLLEKVAFMDGASSFRRTRAGTVAMNGALAVLKPQITKANPNGIDDGDVVTVIDGTRKFDVIEMECTDYPGARQHVVLARIEPCEFSEHLDNEPRWVDAAFLRRVPEYDGKTEDEMDEIYDRLHG